MGDVTRDPAELSLSEHDAALLDKSGFVADPAAATAAQLDRDIRMQELIHRSLSVTDAAERLGVTATRIRQRLADGTLWAFTSGRSRLLPPAQFTTAGGVPHLEKVMPLVAKDLHPLTVQALLTQPQPSLSVKGRQVSMAQWLTDCAGNAQEIDQAADVVTAAAWALA
ncbi:hypothetical protein [Rhodococcus sp. 1168]|uniref:hypothetical protein n=1 Tax=Rhodococcus sp. 1168 TaxID=2018041 RepID=UPI000A0E6ADE|nr:hypothetical protein [Rhodococcus sp. 1168]ORI18335.1 hypothetical protein BJI47_20720 [Rhodococcus sp. 1168]